MRMCVCGEVITMNIPVLELSSDNGQDQVSAKLLGSEEAAAQ